MRWCVQNFALNSFTSLMVRKAKRADYNGKNLAILPGVKHREASPDVMLRPHLGRAWKVNVRTSKDHRRSASPVNAVSPPLFKHAYII